MASGSRESATWVSVRNTAIAPIGTLTKKIHSQPMPEVMIPPSTGPTATAAPVTAPKTPNAVPRSLPWKAWAISASEVANIIAPPVPCTARARLSISGVLGQAADGRGGREHEQARDEHALAADRSATAPEVSRNAASVSA